MEAECTASASACTQSAFGSDRLERDVESYQPITSGYHQEISVQNQQALLAPLNRRLPLDHQISNADWLVTALALLFHRREMIQGRLSRRPPCS